MASRVLYGFLMGLPIVTTFSDLVLSVAKVEGSSMQPTLNPDPITPDYILLSKLGKYNVSRGDVVTIISPKNEKMRLVKRIIGVGGDTIITMGYKKDTVTIPQGHIWVEGDHTEQSVDSNVFGPVSLGLVDAKVICIIWPLHRMQSIDRSFTSNRN